LAFSNGVGFSGGKDQEPFPQSWQFSISANISLKGFFGCFVLLHNSYYY